MTRRERFARWLKQLLCDHGYWWGDPRTGETGCHWCGKRWPPDPVYQRSREATERLLWGEAQPDRHDVL